MPIRLLLPQFIIPLALVLTEPAFSQATRPSPILSAIDFETPPVFKASELLTPDQLTGPYHKVREDVTTNGVTNTYTIDSDFGVFVVHGNDLLPVRIREFYAIAAIRKTKDTDAYTKAIGKAAKGTLDGAKNLITKPGESIAGIGKGAIRFMKGATERARTMTSQSETASDLTSYSDAKRQIAGHYGVDPYTSNPVLRKEIDDLSLATAAGGLTFSLATMAIPGSGVGLVAKGINYSAQLNEMLLEKGPYTLRTENRERLRAMALDNSLIESFLNHSVLNPKHQTVISLALEKLGRARERGTFLRLAMTAQSEEDARFFTHSAVLMALYNKTRSPVLEALDFNGMPACYTADKKIVLPILLDYGSWSETGEKFARLFLEFEKDGLPIEAREWFITGTLSPRAKQETAARGLLVTENVLTDTNL